MDGAAPIPRTSRSASPPVPGDARYRGALAPRTHGSPAGCGGVITLQAFTVSRETRSKHTEHILYILGYTMIFLYGLFESRPRGTRGGAELESRADANASADAKGSWGNVMIVSNETKTRRNKKRNIVMSYCCWAVFPLTQCHYGLTFHHPHTH